jgi:predicted GNAT family acetyltransferase
MWHSIAVEPHLAGVLEPALVAKYPTLHAFDDIHHVLRRPPAARRHRDVRRATVADLDNLRTSGLFDDSVPIEDAVRAGLVACARVDGRIVGQASCIAMSDRYGDVGVGVDDAHRRRGLAAAAAAIVCTQLRAADRIPVWSTGNDNVASLRTAAAVGFEATDGLVILSRFVGEPSV